MTHRHRRCSSSSSWERGPWSYSGSGRSWESWPTPTSTNTPKPNAKRVWFPQDGELVQRCFFYDHPSALDSRKSVPVVGHIECPYRMLWISSYRTQILKHLDIVGQPFMDPDLCQDDLWWSCLRRHYDNTVTEHHRRTFNSLESSSCSRKRSQVWDPSCQSFVEVVEIWNEIWNEPSNVPLNSSIRLPVVHQLQNGRDRSNGFGVKRRCRRTWVTACWQNVILFKAVLCDLWAIAIKIPLCSSPARCHNFDSDLDYARTWSNL